MKSEYPINLEQKVLVPTCGGIIILLIILIMNKDYPFVGHDYRYFIPRLIDTDLHISLNGLSIQWYTPSFGGGLPAFPNPQHIEYSIVQWLSIPVTPWLAILLSTAAISLVGYYFFYKFLNEKLELNWKASVLGAMFFIGNGFYIEHLIAGLLGYQLFPLAAVILYALTDQRNKYFYNSALIAAVITLMIHQAGFYLLLIFALSFSITLPILFWYKPLAINVRRIALTTLTAIILSGAMAASKVYAVSAFMNHFPRTAFDSYEAGFLQAMIGIVAQLLGVMTLEPFLLIAKYNPDFLSGALSNITGTKYGIWETDTGLSPVLVTFLFLGLAQAISLAHRNTKPILNRFSLSSFILLALPIWVTTEMILAKGIIYTNTKQLPILKSLHINIRFTSAFILPLIIVGTIQLHRYFLQNSKRVYFFVIAGLTSISLFSYFFLSNMVYENDFSVKASDALHEKIENGMTFPVIDITDSAAAQWWGFSDYSSLFRPYEPIFGYELEAFATEIHPGKVLEINNGYFNMTNPASLVYPEINNLHPFERIKATEREKLEIFLERRQPEWNIPLAQRILNIISLVAFILDGGLLLVTSISRIAGSADRDRSFNH
ncbi:MAG TPA: hypothetical protein VK249_07635 [Anaerolineales bacterium]|nr:hypothetical protein [Anaerolineales bacterium]